ncbi:hypothetical protein EVAR_39052_1 [Eumeta japonica]|uniref:Uncharacterized protein n=1 Tax=Eumeta variegata TaxID=151549 RepID=A0A4C1WNU4_EUMVA|nr:hypothetical protein EVAR_39052_1 [Eumeta japonica]
MRESDFCDVRFQVYNNSNTLLDLDQPRDHLRVLDRHGSRDQNWDQVRDPGEQVPRCSVSAVNVVVYSIKLSRSRCDSNDTSIGEYNTCSVILIYSKNFVRGRSAQTFLKYRIYLDIKRKVSRVKRCRARATTPLRRRRPGGGCPPALMKSAARAAPPAPSRPPARGRRLSPVSREPRSRLNTCTARYTLRENHFSANTRVTKSEESLNATTGNGRIGGGGCGAGGVGRADAGFVRAAYYAPRRDAVAAPRAASAAAPPPPRPIACALRFITFMFIPVSGIHP